MGKKKKARSRSTRLQPKAPSRATRILKGSGRAAKKLGYDVATSIIAAEVVAHGPALLHTATEVGQQVLRNPMTLAELERLKAGKPPRQGAKKKAIPRRARR